MNAPQGSEAWLIERAGYCTASRMADVMATVKSGEAAGRKKYRVQLAVERITGLPMRDGFQSAAMQRGTEMEPIARMHYEVARGTFVEKVGFQKHPAIEWFGASPDGHVDDDGLVEIKAPESHTHIDYLLAGAVPADYRKQILAQLACTGRRWCDFVSFDDRLPENMRLFIVRFEPKPEEIAEVEAAAKAFLADVDALVDKLRKR